HDVVLEDGRTDLLEDRDREDRDRDRRRDRDPGPERQIDGGGAEQNREEGAEDHRLRRELGKVRLVGDERLERGRAWGRLHAGVLHDGHAPRRAMARTLTQPTGGVSTREGGPGGPPERPSI